MAERATVIVPARDEGDSVAELVQRLAAQTIPREEFEVVIADDGSSDGSTDALPSDDGWLRVLRGPPANAYAARNRAVAASRSTVIASCDADCLPEPEWLAAGLAALENADIVAGLIKAIIPPRRTIWTLLDIDTFVDQEHVVRMGGGLTGNLFFRRRYFDLVNGFDGSLPNGGDQDFVRRCVAAGARLEFSNEAIVWHPSHNTASAFLHKFWNVNRRYAMREAGQNRRPYATRLRWWIPVVSTLRARRRVGRSLRLDRTRLARSGVEPTLFEDVIGIVMLYGVLQYLAGAAQVVGWLSSEAWSHTRQSPRRRRRSTALGDGKRGD